MQKAPQGQSSSSSVSSSSSQSDHDFDMELAGPHHGFNIGDMSQQPLGHGDPTPFGDLMEQSDQDDDEPPGLLRRDSFPSIRMGSDYEDNNARLSPLRAESPDLGQAPMHIGSDVYDGQPALPLHPSASLGQSYSLLPPSSSSSGFGSTPSGHDDFDEYKQAVTPFARHGAGDSVLALDEEDEEMPQNVRDHGAEYGDDDQKDNASGSMSAYASWPGGSDDEDPIMGEDDPAPTPMAPTAMGPAAQPTSGRPKRTTRSTRQQNFVKQLSGSDEESDQADDQDDGDYADPRKTKPLNPLAAIAGKPVAHGNQYQYVTKGGAEHSEQTDANGVITTVTKKVKYDPDAGRAKTKRTGILKMHDHYGRSSGQQTRMQMTQSHNTPSMVGMPSGGEFRNGSTASNAHNARVAEFDNANAKRTTPFTYTTQTTRRPVADLAKDVAHVNAVASRLHASWQNPARVRQRFEKVAAKDPNAHAVMEEKRSIHGTGQPKSTTIGPDYQAWIPPRALGPALLAKYQQDTGTSQSDGNDSDLSEPPKPGKKYPPKKKKVTKKKAKKGPGSDG